MVLPCAGLLKEALSDAQHTKVLIDGFPRVLDQLKEFEHEVCFDRLAVGTAVGIG